MLKGMAFAQTFLHKLLFLAYGGAWERKDCFFLQANLACGALALVRWMMLQWSLGGWVGLWMALWMEGARRKESCGGGELAEDGDLRRRRTEMDAWCGRE